MCRNATYTRSPDVTIEVLQQKHTLSATDVSAGVSSPFHIVWKMSWRGPPPAAGFAMGWP
jgi:hypothetical protein